MRNFLNLFKSQWWRFEWRYWRHRTPWDTQITPPEVMAFVEQTPPGRALDLGCGTGTNAITLARRKWQVTAIDFSVKAVASARRKASAAGLDIDFRRGDVSDLSGVRGPFDYALDIGCLFTLSPEARQSCIGGLAELMPAGGRYMLYAWQPGRFGGKVMGMTPQEVSALVGPYFHQDRMVEGRDGDKVSAWYWFTRI
jgi:cyclopropane fatty-acyl-phospholipid synthase-like methyltransferase